MKGHNGRGCSIDGVQEKVNKCGKKLLDHNYTEDRILTKIPQLNHLMQIEANILLFIRGSITDYSKHLGSKDQSRMIARMVLCLENCCGATDFGRLCRHQPSNQFNTTAQPNLAAPWAKVARGTAGWQRWVDEQHSKIAAFH